MPKLCDNVWFQRVGEPVAEFLAGMPEDPSPRRYVHLCNPHAPLTESDRTQEVTYTAMHRARKECEAAGIQVEYLAGVFPKDESFGARFFDRTFPLRRSAKDIKAFAVERPLPLLFDILEGAQTSEADYIVFTNADICPVPHFYRVVDAMLARGYDSLVINRRILQGWPADPELVGLMAIDHGSPHQGYDCFVFRCDAAARFIRNSALVGAGGVMQSLIYNLVATSRRLLFLGDVHLTWHLGDEHPWKAPQLRDYIEHNWSEAVLALQGLASANPTRFADFCRNFPHSRVEAIEIDGRIELRRKPGCTAFLPDLGLVNRGFSRIPSNGLLRGE